MSQRSCTTVLLVEDNRGDARLLREMLSERGSPHKIAFSHVETMGAAVRHLVLHTVDVVLLDLGLPDAAGLEAVQRAHAVAPSIPLVVITGIDDDALAIVALQEGAQDYLVKGQIEPRGLLRALRYAIERKTLQEALFVERQRAQVTLDCIADAVLCTDDLERITFLNPVAHRLTGWSSKEAAGRPVGEVLRVQDAEGVEVVREPALIRGQDLRLPVTCNLVARNGALIPIENSVAAIHDGAGRASGAVVVFRDVSTAQAASLQMIHLAQHDFLTGLPNRLLLSDRVGQAIVLARRHNTRIAVLYLDLDGFKHINDSLGHPVGDGLLKSVAGRLIASGRGLDTVSRQGGDEFVILLSEVQHAEDAAIVAQRILQAVALPHLVGQHELHVTTSIGVSIFPDDGVDADTLIKNADTAMYQAKEAGRHGYQYFKPAMNARAVERQSIEASLRRALERHELSLHYQPKINFQTGAITGAEALLRWTHPTRGSVPPGQFISVAEDCGLIQSIGNWVLRQACGQARAWLNQGLPAMTMAVNVSAVEFRQEGFLDGVFSALRDHELEPSALELELTESVLMKQAESAAVILHSLRELGVQVAVDDFGTGYSSLSYLRKFPVDALKIDQSFVARINNADDASIVAAVISMAQILKLRVVAEGVETQEQLRFLRGHGCDEAQGFYFSRPLPAPEFAKLLRTGIPSHSEWVAHA